MTGLTDKKPARPAELAAGAMFLGVCLWFTVLVAGPALKTLAAQCTVVLARPGDFFIWISNPLTGEEVLSGEVRSMLDLLRRHGVTEFRYADWPIEEKVPDEYREYTRQRVTEGAYPIRRSEDAIHLVSPSPRSIPGSCRILELAEHAVLASCP